MYMHFIRAALVSAAAAQPAAFPENDLDPDIPAPGEVIGHEIGAAAVRYDALVRYLHALDDASDLVTLRSYARTHEGRELYYLTITSKANRCASCSFTCPLPGWPCSCTPTWRWRAPRR